LSSAGGSCSSPQRITRHTNASASTSSPALCVGVCEPNASARSPNRWLDSLGRPMRESCSESSHAPRNAAVPATCSRKDRSNPTLCAITSRPATNSTSRETADSAEGAPLSIESSMPVSRTISGGTGLPGSTSVENRSVISGPRATAAAISMTRSRDGSNPVVSISTNTTSSSKPKTASRARRAYASYSAAISGSVPGTRNRERPSFFMRQD
jgi:hypothetical protein